MKKHKKEIVFFTILIIGMMGTMLAGLIWSEYDFLFGDTRAETTTYYFGEPSKVIKGSDGCYYVVDKEGMRHSKGCVNPLHDN